MKAKLFEELDRLICANRKMFKDLILPSAE